MVSGLQAHGLAPDRPHQRSCGRNSGGALWCGTAYLKGCAAGGAAGGTLAEDAEAHLWGCLTSSQAAARHLAGRVAVGHLLSLLCYLFAAPPPGQKDGRHANVDISTDKNRANSLRGTVSNSMMIQGVRTHAFSRA